MARTRTNFGAPAQFRVTHLDANGVTVEQRLIFSTNAAKAHRKMREMLGWEDDVLNGDVFVLEQAKGTTWTALETFEVVAGGDDVAEDAPVAHAA